MLGADIKAAQCGTGAGGPPIAPSAEALADIPGNYLQLYQQAAAHYELGGDGWSWLAGIGSVETDHGRLRAPGVSSGENSAGAGGPMQFLADTWASYGVDGNRDGRVSRYDPRDAIPAAARYLHASGAPGDWPRALFAYNHAGWYGADVAARAAAHRRAAPAHPTGPPPRLPRRRAGQPPRPARRRAAGRRREHTKPAHPAAGPDRAHARRPPGA